MKRDKNFFFTMTLILFTLCYAVSLILACRTVTIFNLTITASIFFYPLTYFITIVFKERYGNENTKLMFMYAIFALIFMVLMFTISSMLPYTKPDGLESIFNIDYRLVFASITAFVVGHYLCIHLYDYLTGFRGFKFLIASVIAITIDNIIFIGLSFLGVLPLSEFANMFVGQYVFSILMIIVYAIFFTYIIDTVVKKADSTKEEVKVTKKKEVKEEKKPVKKVTKKK